MSPPSSTSCFGSGSSSTRYTISDMLAVCHHKEPWTERSESTRTMNQQTASAIFYLDRIFRFCGIAVVAIIFVSCSAFFLALIIRNRAPADDQLNTLGAMLAFWLVSAGFLAVILGQRRTTDRIIAAIGAPQAIAAAEPAPPPLTRKGA